MFKKIFDLDPKEVEKFIKNLVKERYKRSFEPEEYEQWLKDYEPEVQWHLILDEFYVQIEPKLTTKDYNRWYFKTDKELTAGEYFKLAFGHEHFYFREIYGLITGGPICYSSYSCRDPNHEGYSFITNKEYVSIEKDKTDNHYYIRTYDEENDKEVFTLLACEAAIARDIKDYENNRRKIYSMKKE